jgi:hypothetical protein
MAAAAKTIAILFIAVFLFKGTFFSFVIAINYRYFSTGTANTAPTFAFAAVTQAKKQEGITKTAENRIIFGCFHIFMSA